MISKEKDPSGYFERLLTKGMGTLPPPELPDEKWMAAHMPPAPADSNKGFYGKAVVYAGSALYPGAALLAAKACLAGGGGILTVFSREEVRPYFTNLPEAIFRAALPEGLLAASRTALSAAHAVCLGPGWGEGAYGEILAAAMRSDCGTVLDADALNYMAKHPEAMALLSANCVLTPHPGEMSRLLGCSIGSVLADPAGTARSFAGEHRCTVLLKGTCTIITDGTRMAITAEGNCGLAKGGSGDVLSGLITAMLCRGKSPFEAACLGSLLLGVGAKRAFAALRERMLRATDITEVIKSDML